MWTQIYCIKSQTPCGPELLLNSAQHKIILDPACACIAVGIEQLPLKATTWQRLTATMTVAQNTRLPTYFIGHGETWTEPGWFQVTVLTLSSQAVLVLRLNPSTKPFDMACVSLANKSKPWNQKLLFARVASLKVKAMLSKVNRIMESARDHLSSPRLIRFLVNFKEPTRVWHDLGPSWKKTFPHVF